MHPSTPLLRLFLVALVAPAAAQVESALVTRRGGAVQGLVEGSVFVLSEDADVTVQDGAIITGDLVLPADKSASASEANPRQSQKAKVKVIATDAVKGRQRAAVGLELPKTQPARTPNGKDSVVLQTPTGGEPDFKKTKDFTVQNSKRELVIPPGAYGALVVENGKVILGRKGSPAPTRYDFQSISVQPNAEIDIAGPVIVTVGSIPRLKGTIGNSQYSNWLDLRVVGGALGLDPNSAVHGVVSAASSVVTIGRGAKVRGGLVCDQVNMEGGSTFTGVSPSWAKESSGNSLPLFVHKAARVASRLPELREKYSGDFAIAAHYANDEPTLILEKTAHSGARLEQHQTREAFFDACCTLFENTGFARGMIVLFEPAAPATKSAKSTTEVTLEREQFQDHVWAIAHEEDLRAGIRKIRNDPLLLNLFMLRALKVSRAFVAKGAGR